MNKATHIKKNVTAALTTVMFFFLLACNQSQQKITIEGFDDRARVPDLDASDVVTVISDSGVTRYRIEAARWLVYSKAEKPYWYFPKGIKLEDFDQDMTVFAHLRANTARYDYNNQIWRLEGKVYARNVNGEEFKTPRLFWNQKTEIVYSDTIIEVNSNGTVLKGTGFLSNQTMTKYTVKNPTGYSTNGENGNRTSSLIPAVHPTPASASPDTANPKSQDIQSGNDASQTRSITLGPNMQKPKHTKGPAALRMHGK